MKRHNNKNIVRDLFIGWSTGISLPGHSRVNSVAVWDHILLLPKLAINNPVLVSDYARIDGSAEHVTYLPGKKRLPLITVRINTYM